MARIRIKVKSIEGGTGGCIFFLEWEDFMEEELSKGLQRRDPHGR